MQIIALQSVPRQKFTAIMDGVVFDIRLVAAGNCMYADISNSGVPVVSGMKCCPGTALLPYRYMEGQAGQFIFATGANNTELPWWENFNTDQTLYYVTAAELAGLRT